MKQMCVYGMVLLLTFSLTTQGTAQESLTWKDCVKEALKQHPDVISAKEKVRQTEADRKITRSAILPQVTTEASGRRSDTETQPEQESYAYAIRGSQLLFDGFKTSSELKAATQTMVAQEYDYAVVSSNVRLALKKAFASLLRAQELISLTEEIAERRRQNVDLIRLRYEAGREHRGALLTAEADLAQASFEVARAKRNLFVAQRELSKELGRKEVSPITAAGSFDMEDLPVERPDFESLAGETPFLKELIARKEAAQWGVKSARAEFFPQVYLNASFGETATDWPPKDDEWSAGVTLSLPIFEGGSRPARVSKSKSQLSQLEADQESGRDSVLLTLEKTWKGLQDAADFVSVQKKFLDAGRERAKIAGAQYSTGLVAFDDWIIIENNLVSAKKAYLDAQADLLVAEANWYQAKGGTLEDVQE
ncbi:MAG: TolC family protein [Thermodesulfobacteriota bacterium]|nr:TolC family protein [Thermodesulfobacteriota bacterium]